MAPGEAQVVTATLGRADALLRGCPGQAPGVEAHPCRRGEAAEGWPLMPAGLPRAVLRQSLVGK